jgi:hypothetical protein
VQSVLAPVDIAAAAAGPRVVVASLGPGLMFDGTLVPGLGSAAGVQFVNGKTIDGKTTIFSSSPTREIAVAASEQVFVVLIATDADLVAHLFDPFAYEKVVFKVAVGPTRDPSVAVVRDKIFVLYGRPGQPRSVGWSTFSKSREPLEDGQIIDEAYDDVRHFAVAARDDRVTIAWSGRRLGHGVVRVGQGESMGQAIGSVRTVSEHGDAEHVALSPGRSGGMGMGEEEEETWLAWSDGEDTGPGEARRIWFAPVRCK